MVSCRGKTCGAVCAHESQPKFWKGLVRVARKSPYQNCGRDSCAPLFGRALSTGKLALIRGALERSMLFTFLRWGARRQKLYNIIADLCSAVRVRDKFPFTRRSETLSCAGSNYSFLLELCRPHLPPVVRPTKHTSRFHTRRKTIQFVSQPENRTRPEKGPKVEEKFKGAVKHP